MNAEKLYFLAKGLQKEFKNFETTKNIQDVIDQIESWNETIVLDYGSIEFKNGDKKAYSKKKIKSQIDKMLHDMFFYLDNSNMNNSSIYLRKGLDELSAVDYFGLNLKNKILSIIQRIIDQGFSDYSKFW